MYCQKCGKQIDDGSAFCQYCGSKINGEMVSRNNFVVQRQSTEHTKSKAEEMACRKYTSIDNCYK